MEQNNDYHTKYLMKNDLQVFELLEDSLVYLYFRLWKELAILYVVFWNLPPVEYCFKTMLPLLSFCWACSIWVNQATSSNLDKISCFCAQCLIVITFMHKAQTHSILHKLAQVARSTWMLYTWLIECKQEWHCLWALLYVKESDKVVKPVFHQHSNQNPMQSNHVYKSIRWQLCHK